MWQHQWWVRSVDERCRVELSLTRPHLHQLLHYNIRLKNMGNHISLRLRFPIIADPAHHENFFVGAWHPYKKITVKTDSFPDSVKCVSLTSENWFLLSSLSPVHAGEAGLIHEKKDKAGAAAFRGYILNPPIHSYSPSEDILKYWVPPSPVGEKNPAFSSEPNGVFSAVCIRDKGKTLELITDAFGIGTLYYRVFKDLILFATNTRYLSLYPHDTPDYMAWRSLIEAGFITGERTLLTSVRRTPPGQILCFRQGKVSEYKWFDFGSLPPGTKEIDDQAIAAVEDAFKTALSRSLRLKAEGYFLALSSGYDSRRILAGLLARKITFQAATVQIFQKGYRDLDASFSSLMAKDMGFPHRVILSENAWEYAQDDYKKRILLDAESNNFHTWAVGLMRSLPKDPILFLEGLGGDALGESGFDRVPGLHLSEDPDSILIARHTVTDDFNRILNPKKFPTINDLRNEIINDIESLPSGMNQAELAFLLLRARRSTALCSQQMLPAGHVAVYPYMDLDYIRTALTYNPVSKLHSPLQKSCLKKYWYSYYIYPGSRAVPPEMPPGNIRLHQEREIASFQESKKILLRNNGLPELMNLLTKTASLQLFAAFQSNWIALRSTWAFKPIMDLVSHHLEKIGCWEILSEE